MNDADILGDSTEAVVTPANNEPIDPMNYVPQASTGGKSLLNKFPKLSEDSERDYENQIKQVSQNIPGVILPTIQRAEPDYAAIAAYLQKEEHQGVYAIKNVSDVPLVSDWDLTLMAPDMVIAFKAYLAQKYSLYKFKPLSNGVSLVVIRDEFGNTINFMENFTRENNVPTMVARQIGREIQVKSQMVIQPGEAVIMLESQTQALKKYWKIKEVFDDRLNDKGVPMVSDWLGFLVRKEITVDELSQFNRSFFSFADIMKTESRVDPQELIRRSAQKVTNEVMAEWDNTEK